VKNPQLQRIFPITEKRVELKTDKMSQLEVGTGGWPPISTWIMGAPWVGLCTKYLDGGLNFKWEIDVG
jgi:hypothetical protein